MIIKYKYGKNFRAVCKTARSNDSSGARVNIKNSKKKQFKKEEEGNIERQKTKGKKKERKNPDCFAVSQGGGGGDCFNSYRTLIEHSSRPVSAGEIGPLL